MTCYKFKCSHWLKLQHSDWRAIFFKINFPPMRALELCITGHVIYNPAYTYKFQMKTTYLCTRMQCVLYVQHDWNTSKVWNYSQSHNNFTLKLLVFKYYHIFVTLFSNPHHSKLYTVYLHLTCSLEWPFVWLTVEKQCNGKLLTVHRVVMADQFSSSRHVKYHCK